MQTSKCFKYVIVTMSHKNTTMFYRRHKQARNQVQRLTKQLRQKYYEKKVDGLCTCYPRNWWRAVKRITGDKHKSWQPLVGLAQ